MDVVPKLVGDNGVRHALPDRDSPADGVVSPVACRGVVSKSRDWDVVGCEQRGCK